MGVVTGMQKANSLYLTGALGPYRRWRAGEITWEQAQAENKFAGIYQRVRTLKGPAICKRRFFKPANPQSMGQTFRRTIFSAGVILWQGLTPEGKATYNERAKRLKMSGWNLFMREWLANF